MSLVDPNYPLGLAIQSLLQSQPNIERVQGVIRNRLGELELHTVEDAITFLQPLVSAIAKFFHISAEQLERHMVRIEPTANLFETVQDPIARTIFEISSVLGGPEVPHLHYNTQTNIIYINEESPGGFSLDQLGEEVSHWAREIVFSQEGTHDPAVHEMFGFLGRRIVRSALGLPDIRQRPEDYQKGLELAKGAILDLELFPSMIDTGKMSRLRMIYQHVMGYAVASNIPLQQIQPELIRLGDRSIREIYFRKYGPPNKWLREEERRTRMLHAKVAREAPGLRRASGDTSRSFSLQTSVDDLLKPLLDAWNGS